jgi:hypothetical protein
MKSKISLIAGIILGALLAYGLYIYASLQLIGTYNEYPQNAWSWIINKRIYFITTFAIFGGLIGLYIRKK